MKANDYVRSSWGTISRIKKYEHDEDGTGFSINIENECFGTHYENKSQFDNDYKTSSNITDLIKVGDIIRGKDNHLFEVYAVGSDCVYINNLEEFILVNEIKSIVTKENFKSMEYRIGE